MIRVLLESPYAGDVDRNVEYARRAMLDCLSRGESPYAGHLLLTQVLDDNDPAQRAQGIAAHLAWIHVVHLIAVYVDYNISDGMEAAMILADTHDLPIDSRMIGKNP